MPRADAGAALATELGARAEDVERVPTPRGGTLLGFRCAPDACLDLWRRARERHPATGWWPFITHTPPSDWEWAELPGGSHRDETRGPFIAGLVELQAGELLQEAETFRPPTGHLPVRDLDDLARRLTAALPHPAPPRPAETRLATFSVGPPEWICLVPTDDPVGLPELLDAPDTPNHTPFPGRESLSYRDHADVLREWHDRFGAEICYLDTAALLLSVGSPPTDPLQAARVAIEQYAYCPDFDQLIGGLPEIAAHQAPAPFWFFWWD
ncbi:hypothetical protein BJ965_002885 [Streptomyces luteogriseus]|uniref:DUF4253 domain-containing protein n=1 Tax=Streptomyces luteogriseus TaxID=68233 RepID=A0A7W7DLI3_9ACTN|nr:DUF4253 domain-containing protein [Streptomyces luteogriseus]MBB4713003.1 hypothetical protein [Streptomyces luteogriseus]